MNNGIVLYCDSLEKIMVLYVKWDNETKYPDLRYYHYSPGLGYCDGPVLSCGWFEYGRVWEYVGEL